MADGTKVERIANHDSHYGNLKVVDYSYAEKHHRDMLIDGQTQRGIDVNNGLSLYEYPYLLQFLPFALHPEGKSCLMIGLGAGIVPVWYQAQGVKTEVVDIDPEVVNFARKYFNFNPEIPVHIEDARYFLTSTKRRYDYVILDVFNGDTTPGHLISVEAMRSAKAHLTDNGVFAVNIIGSVEHDTFMTASIIKTLQSVFDNVSIYSASDASLSEGVSNLVVVAYGGSPRAVQLDRVPNMDTHPLVEDAVRNSIREPFSFPPQAAIVLTDDYNPVDFYDLWLKEIGRAHV
jgi:spermidine synthase